MSLHDIAERIVEADLGEPSPGRTAQVHRRLTAGGWTARDLEAYIASVEHADQMPTITDVMEGRWP